MKKEDLRIVFMGTPDFAVTTLKTLVENEFHVVGVVTAPDRPAGRGKRMTSSAVKNAAMELGLPVLQPEKLKEEQFLLSLKQLNAHLQIVVAFRMLPEVVWNMPPMGTFNLHASLLPQYRGAAPINHALMNGETVSGITTFMLDQEIDTGKILFQEKVMIDSDDDAESYHDKLMVTGAKLVIKTTEALIDNNYHPVNQESLFSQESELKKAPKIFKPDCIINWKHPGDQIYNFVRGLSPYPAAISTLMKKNGEQVPVKIYKVHFIKGESGKKLGLVICPDKKTLLVQVTDGIIQIEVIQQAGKKRMNADEFLRGAGDLSGSLFFDAEA